MLLYLGFSFFPKSWKRYKIVFFLFFASYSPSPYIKKMRWDQSCPVNWLALLYKNFGNLENVIITPGKDYLNTSLWGVSWKVVTCKLRSISLRVKRSGICESGDCYSTIVSCPQKRQRKCNMSIKSL